MATKVSYSERQTIPTATKVLRSRNQATTTATKVLRSRNQATTTSAIADILSKTQGVLANRTSTAKPSPGTYISNPAISNSVPSTQPTIGTASDTASTPSAISGVPPKPANPTTGNTYVVGGGYTPDNSAYAAGTDENAVALQAYDKQLQAYKQALQASYDAQANSIANEVAKSRQQYIGNRNDTYTNARLSAIGNNERLAAKGLAGNLYDYARSGTSETSRIAQDVAMRKNIAGIDQAQINAQNEFQLALINAQKEADANYANKVAEVEIAKIPYLTALAQAAAMSSSGGSGGSSRTYAKSSSKKSSSGGGSGNSSNNKRSGDKNGDGKYDGHDSSLVTGSRDGTTSALSNKDNLDKYLEDYKKAQAAYNAKKNTAATSGVGNSGYHY